MLTKDVVKIQALPCPKPSGYDPLNPFPHTQNPPKTVFARFEPLAVRFSPRGLSFLGILMTRRSF